MLLIRLAVRNLLRHPVKTGLIAAFITVGTALILLANTVFESTTRGLESSLVGSLTGHFVVAPLTEEAYGIFGNEVPIVGVYESIPSIDDFGAVSGVLDGDDRVAAWSPLVSSLAQLGMGKYRTGAVTFGVDPETYFEVCSDLQIISGNAADLSSGGVFLNENMAAAIRKHLGRALVPGEEINFSVAAKNSFRVRTGTFAGVYRYPAPSEVLDRVVLADPVMVRALLGYTLGYAKVQEAADAPDATTGMEDLFLDTQDIQASSSEGLTLDGVEKAMGDTSARDQLVATDNGAWSFALARAERASISDRIRKSVAKELRNLGTEVRVLDWPTAAGANALMLFAVRSAFNIGVAFLIFGSMLVVMNTLVISVLERTSEIGSMRALGASRAFIRRLFILETMLLTFFSAACGVLLGSILASLAAFKGIPLENPLLISLFGGSVLRPGINLPLVVNHLVAAALIGSVAWLYPVILALRVSPVAAMSEHE